MRKPLWLLIPLGILIAIPLTCMLGLVGLRYSLERNEHRFWTQQLEKFDQSKDDTIINPHPDYLDELLENRPVAERVKTIIFSSSLNDQNPNLSTLNQLPNVRELILYSTFTGTDALLAAFEGKESIERVSLETAHISDAGIESLAKYPNLKDILLRRGGSLSLAPLRRHPSLSGLTIEWLQVTAENFDVLPDIPNLDHVTWESEHYSEEIREQFASVEGFERTIVSAHADGFRASLQRKILPPAE